MIDTRAGRETDGRGCASLMGPDLVPAGHLWAISPHGGEREVNTWAMRKPEA